MGFFSKKDDGDQPSVIEVMRRGKAPAVDPAEVKLQVAEALIETESQRRYYADKARVAIEKARRAKAAGDQIGLKSAYAELKMAHSYYHYMTTLNSSFATIQAQVQMQDMAQKFAGVVNGLRQIKISQPDVNYAKLTKKALQSFKGIDLQGMDRMLDELVGGTVGAELSLAADDGFLEGLVDGRYTLDELPRSVSPAASETAASKRPVSSDTVDIDRMIAALDELG